MTATEREALAGLLRRGAARLGGELAGAVGVRRRWELGEHAVAALLTYLDVLLLWRRKMSLIATADPAEIVERHVIDSLALLSFVAPGERVADLGSGAGFPGVVLGLAAADVEVLLVEPRRKRASFLAEVVRATGAANLQVAPQRAEELALDAAAAPDVVVSRAFGPLEVFLAAVERMVAATARPVRVIVMKGAGGLAQAEPLAARFGMPQEVLYHLPDSTPRSLLVYESFPFQPR